MINVVSIVEGDGEVVALPILLRRINQWCSPRQQANVMRPIRVRRDQFLHKDDEFRRILVMASSKCADSGWILILLDADDDCPAELGAHTLERAREVASHRNISVVFANREFEAWFLAAGKSIHGFRGFSFAEACDFDPERPRDAKGWMRRHMTSGHYSEITDQPAFSSRMDLEQAFKRSRSFRKLCNEWKKQASVFSE